MFNTEHPSAMWVGTFHSILRIFGRIALILLAAGIVIGLAYGLSRFTGNQSRFRSDGGGQRFTQPQAGDNNGQFARPPRGGEDEGFRENGSIVAGLIQVLTKAVVIGVFTWIGLLVLYLVKRKPLQTSG